MGFTKYFVVVLVDVKEKVISVIFALKQKQKNFFL